MKLQFVLPQTRRVLEKKNGWTDVVLPCPDKFDFYVSPVGMAKSSTQAIDASTLVSLTHIAFMTLSLGNRSREYRSDPSSANENISDGIELDASYTSLFFCASFQSSICRTTEKI